jgi:thioredoxin 1
MLKNYDSNWRANHMKLIKLEKHRCNFCNQLTALLDGEGIPYESHNIDDKPEIAAKYGAMSAPVLILEDDNGNVVTQVNGFYRDQVDQTIQRFQEGGA